MNSTTIDPAALMRLAIDKASDGIADGQTPFGCAIAFDDKVVAVCHNIVWRETDITAHAEITALRAACRTLGRILLDGCTVASTCEPCPMCMSALHWARVDKVYFGATIAEAATAGFNELAIPASQVVELGGSSVQLESGLLRDDCLALFDRWRAAQGRAY